MLDREIEDLGFLPCTPTLPQGSYSQVALAVDDRAGEYVVCKLCHLETHAISQHRWMHKANARGVRCVPKVLRLDGRWIVYEHARGETIAQMAERGASDDHVIIAALATAVAVLELASHGLVHGDLHPGNVVIDRSAAMLIDPHSTGLGTDDADGLIDSFVMAGFMSRHDARDCGVRIPGGRENGVPERHIRGVCDVLRSVMPTLRQATRAARRALEETRRPASSGSLENLMASPTERQEGDA